jgi:large subunit ribosomal protein L13
MQRITVSTKAQDIQRAWYVVDASDKVLGRFASKIAYILRGKHKPSYTESSDTGDFVVIINAEKVRVTGRKMSDKVYTRHTGYPGGLKTTSLEKMLDTKPTEVLATAIRGMLPKNKLGRAMFEKCKIYAASVHPHAAQQPKQLDV